MGQDVAKVLLKHKGLLAEALGERKQAPIPGSVGVNYDQRELRKIKAVPLPPSPQMDLTQQHINEHGWIII